MAKGKVDLKEPRYWIYIGFLALFFFIWFVKLFRLQILQGDVYTSEAVHITERIERLNAKRGLIYYNDGQTPIVNNIDVFTVYLVPARVPSGQLENELNLLSQILDIDPERLKIRLNKSKNLLQPIELKRDISIDVIKKIAERRDVLVGVSHTSLPERNLIEDGSIIHVVGYVGKISDYELEVLYNDQYQTNTSIGKTGIEQYYDTILRGYDGRRILTVDAKGNMLDERIDPPKTGLSLTLSIDRKIQKLAEQALGNRIGSAVVMRPATGQILAMVSTPWYKLSDFKSSERFQNMINDLRKPLLNRTIQSQYPPASTFKMVLASAMLAERKFSPTEFIFDPGYWQLGNRLFRCWLLTGHGNVDLIGAIADSCNIYFGVVGVRYLGDIYITSYARKYGFGQLTGIDLPGEVQGFVPNPAWKRQRYNQVWTKGDTLNISIGQGFLLVTPLQVAVYTSAIVNDGIAYKPSLLNRVHNNTEENVSEPEILYTMQLEPSVFQQLKYGMRQAVVRGTARSSIYNGVVDIAAKTGTAEIGLNNHWHSWFTSYGPYEVDDPLERVVVLTQVEADPTVAKENYDWWAPRAADIIYRGIFADETYEEVWLNYKKRGVWFQPMMTVPQQYHDNKPALNHN